MFVGRTNTEYSVKGLMLKLKLQYSGHLILTANSLENILMLGKIEGKKGRGQEGKRAIKDALVGCHHSQWTWV